MNKTLIALLAISVICVAAFAQGPRKGEPPLPAMNLPPGYTAKVGKVSKAYNFWGLKREIPLPWNRIVFQQSDFPKGVKTVDAFSAPSKAAADFFKDPEGKIPQAGKPERTLAQVFKGKKKSDDGTILYMEWKRKLPQDMREQLARLFYNKDVRPDGAQQVEFICSDNTIIIWCFKVHESAVKQLHQEKTFDLVSEMANKIFGVPPASGSGN